MFAALLMLVTVASAGISLDEAEATLKQEATAEWAELEALGDRASDEKLEAFVERYRAAEVTAEGAEARTVSIPELEAAAALLEARYDTGGRTGISSEDLSELMVASRGVKSCWAAYQQETGVRPSGRVSVSITVQPDGRPSEASIIDGSYRGTSLDRCLSTAIRRTKFPPFDGMAHTVEYPFAL